MKVYLSNKEKVVLLGLGIIILLLPLLFTRNIGLESFLNTGEIGDTIGGITAPFTSIVGSVLVYLALKAQIEANKLIQDQIQKQELDEVYRKKITLFNDRINVLRDEINNFGYSHMQPASYGKLQKHNYQGTQAIYQLLKINSRKHVKQTAEEIYNSDTKLLELKLLLVLLSETLKSILVERFNEDESENNEIKTNFYNTIKYYFYAKISGNFDAVDKERTHSKQPCEDCGKIHGLPEELYEIVDSIRDKLT